MSPDMPHQFSSNSHGMVWAVGILSIHSRQAVNSDIARKVANQSKNHPSQDIKLMHLLLLPILGSAIWIGGGSVGLLLVIIIVILLLR
jgi:cellobiose-specific phosphotransferase system component IIC